MPSLAIIADDLTGALDAAAPFAVAGREVAVATGVDGLGAVLESRAEVIAISTRSREIAADAARSVVAHAVAALPRDIQIVKKIDSRLKGNIAAELSVFGDAPLVVLPAIPDFGRIVSDGAVAGFGVETPIPVRSALGMAGARATIPDTLTQADLQAAVMQAGGRSIFVGARGLAQALAGGNGGAPEVPPLPPPLLIAVGSTDPITLAQVAELRRACPDVAYVPAPSGDPAVSGLHSAITLVQAVPGPVRSARSVATRFADALAVLAGDAQTLILTGGATAEAVLDAVGVTCLEVLGEVLPGLPLCRAGGKIYITKSGGFGAPETLARLAATVMAPAGPNAQETA